MHFETTAPAQPGGSTTVVVYGPQGCGKTRYANTLAQHFKLKFWGDLEEMLGRRATAIPPTDHLLLTAEHPQHVRGIDRVKVLSFDQAMRHAGHSSPTTLPTTGVMAADLPPLPDALVMVRDADPPGEDGGWIVDCDCEGPLSYYLEPGEALFTAEQMREYAIAARGVDLPVGGQQ